MLAIATWAHAVSPTLQNTVEKYDPGLTANQLVTPNQIDHTIPPTNNLIIIGGKKSTIPPGKAEQIKFFCNKILISGNKVISSEMLSKIYEDKLKTEISVAQLEKISQQITDYYRHAGYILSQAILPEQEITDKGIAKIQIVEGYIKKVSVTGSTHSTVSKLLNAYAAKIIKDTPITDKKLERYVFLATDIPGVKVRAVITRSDESTGAANLNFIVEEKEVGGNVAFNNYNTAVLGRDQALGNLHLNNLVAASETGISGIIARHIKRLKYISLSHKQQLNSEGLGMRVAASHVKTNPNMDVLGLGQLILPGQATVFLANLEYAWTRSHNKNIYIGAGIKVLDSSTNFDGSNVFHVNSRSFNLFWSYSGFFNANSYNTASLNYSQGFRGFGAESDPPSRGGESLSFTKFELFLSNAQRFNNTRFTTFVAGKAQYTLNSMPASETFIYGGSPFGYGYQIATFSGDSGVAGIIELQHPAYQLASCKLTSMIFAFIDGGLLWDFNKLSPPRHQTGTSAGLGHRVNWMKLHFDFIVAKPLKRSIVDENDNYTKLLFNMKFTW